MDIDTASLLIDFVEKVGLLRRDMQQKKDFERYEARFDRIKQKLDGLAERISRTDPELAKAVRTAWQLPARSLAFRNARHQRDIRTGSESEAPPPPDDKPTDAGQDDPATDSGTEKSG